MNLAFFILFFFVIVYFLFEGSGDAILPIRYDYLLFGMSFLLAAPLYIGRVVAKEKFYTVIALFFLALISTLFSRVPSAFLYVMPIIILLCVSGKKQLNISAGSASLILKFSGGLLLIVGCLFLPFLSKEASGRYSLFWVGNPNYTAMLYVGWYVTVEMTRDNFSTLGRRALILVSNSVMVFVIYMTETRSALLSIVAYWFIRWVARMWGGRLLKFFAHLCVIVSAFGQLVFYMLFSSMGKGFAGRSSFNIFDESNMERVYAFKYALDISLSSPFFLYSGYGNVEGVWDSLQGEIHNVPHNWFMMMVLSNGWIFSLLLLFLFIIYGAKLEKKYIPGFCAIFTIAFIVGRAAIFAPFVLFMCAALVDKKRNENGAL